MHALTFYALFFVFAGALFAPIGVVGVACAIAGCWFSLRGFNRALLR